MYIHIYTYMYIHIYIYVYIYIYTNVIQKSYKDKISIQKLIQIQKAAGKISNLIHKCICNKHDIIPM